MVFAWLAAALAAEAVATASETIKEWHFHVYFLASNEQHTTLANALRRDVVSAVAAGRFVAVCNGVNRTVLPALSPSDAALVPDFNRAAVGPHTSGSFEIWTPREHFAAIVSFLYARRGNLTYFLHPLGQDQYIDHTRDAVFFGTSYPLDLSEFPAQTHCEPTPNCYSGQGQYPSLRLGYDANLDTQ